MTTLGMEVRVDMNAKANQHHEMAQELHEGQYLAAKKSETSLLSECIRKKVIKKPCEGKPHARFDGG